MTMHDNSVFSFPVKVGHVSANPVTITISADQSDLKKLAAQWGVLEVRAFDAEIVIGRWKRDGVRLKGNVTATMVQECVVTLDPVEQCIDENLEAVFLPENSRLVKRITDASGEMFLDPEGPDLPDTFSGDTIDVGAVAAEFAALAIDAYPRKPGLDYLDRIESDETVDKKPSPFAVLQGFKRDE
ncbi:putative metal-binding, possibly nucleic acid-binding protein [Hoeflea phototrophica DFL-43]|uniref:Putative metal-binding, possibly nucleic acid-binding protein n=1 Tax=Hoeflea phototrophica (strain DSM 17068 / NCIMB 14078 / DFL-43) TaxID=411684 RepID=A9D4L9_HOEPD|nr:YceD family protein [Hoeflea phototrophica]EDQ33905.2 putative metal-binding, possibly nucleic acid-binding protein [Hoeflea phototrophica DFL-43]